MSPECTSFDALTEMDNAYDKYCDELLLSDNEPRRACAILLKETESYFCCLYGTKKEDFYLLEQEGVDWLGPFKLCKKDNYVTETLRRIELLYGFGRMTNTEHESLRINRFNVMTIGGNAISNDLLNEFQNLWNQSCVMSPNFEKVSNAIAFAICRSLPCV